MSASGVNVVWGLAGIRALYVAVVKAAAGVNPQSEIGCPAFGRKGQRTH